LPREGLRWRLSVLMFLLYGVPGAWCPLFSLRLEELGFTPLETGWAFTTQALASLVAPLAAGQVADRWWPAERCLSFCALAAGALLWLLAELTSPAAVFATALAFWLAMVPVLTLGVSLSFSHLPSPERDFGGVRVWGTVGWVVPGWLLGYWFTEPAWLGMARSGRDLADAFRLGGVLALALGLYAWMLPHTPPRRRAESWLAPLAALRLLRERSFAVYCAAALGLYLTLPFLQQVVPLLLEHLGIPRPWWGPALTISQSMEIFALVLLPWLLLRVGVRGTMLLGLLAWGTGMTVMAVGQPTWLVVASLGCNGLCICCFLVAGQVFVNSRARGDIRASAQGLLAFTNGLGLFLGSLLVGWVRELTGGAFPPTLAVGAVLAAALVVLFFAGFAPDGTTPARSASEGPR
jgi:MFS family permease